MIRMMKRIRKMGMVNWQKMRIGQGMIRMKRRIEIKVKGQG